MKHPAIQIGLVAAGTALLWGLGGCGTTPGTKAGHADFESEPTAAVFDVPPGRYDAAFSATMEVLQRHRFTPERVDSAQGIITTRPRESSGFAAPWDSEYTNGSQEFEDFVHRQQRLVRVSFEAAPLESAVTQAGQGATQSQQPTPARRARVEVWVERWYVTGQRPSSRAILYSVPTIDPLAARNGMPPEYPVAIARDEVLARRLAHEIERGTLSTP